MLVPELLVDKHACILLTKNGESKVPSRIINLLFRAAGKVDKTLFLVAQTGG